ncbi:MAG: phosphoribosylamine--glycine ligase [Coriobacteriales bacterium]|nr:phosphoribosylamine--glycine ligase [Coriobacteriales bacterium]
MAKVAARDASTQVTTNKVDILLLGAGGREHALLKKLSESSSAGKLWVTPGNGGMFALAQQAPISQDDPEQVASWAKQQHIGLVVIGPEAPLVEGVADAVRAEGIACFGPNASAARMEGSKEFAKQVMMRAGVPTAAYKSFTDQSSCEEYVRSLGGPCVVKADGLAAGKGVIVAQTTEEALAGVQECFGGTFGSAGNTVVVEEMLQGPECSLLALTDGKTVVPLATSQDHKRAYDNDEGPNTGGMGVYSPVPEHLVSSDDLATMTDIMQKVVDQLGRDGITYSGCLYGGFMLTQDGPKVLEFNARFGDPETQVVLPRMHADLVEVFLACDNGTLSADMISWDDDWAVSVVLASKGYPGSYETGKLISGVDEASDMPGITVYHAGTKLNEQGELLTSGGRVLAVTAVAPTFAQARERAYAACEVIGFEGKQFRTDIGVRALV